jgi:hypothetical protein
MVSLNAALYVVVGYLSFLGVFAPIVGVVRFWGVAVVVPAVFAVLFGGMVGGVGAAIGIFISDMLIHGNAILSLTVGVPANFVMFYLIGRLAQARPRTAVMNLGLSTGCLIIIVLFFTNWITGSDFSPVWATILIGFAVASIALSVALVKLGSEWRSFAVASIIGNTCGSAIVGLGIWLLSQFFILPLNLGHQLRFTVALYLFAWTFTNQMPFLLAFVPPILGACYRAFPSLIQKAPASHIAS